MRAACATQYHSTVVEADTFAEPRASASASAAASRTRIAACMPDNLSSVS